MSEQDNFECHFLGSTAQLAAHLRLQGLNPITNLELDHEITSTAILPVNRFRVNKCVDKLADWLDMALTALSGL